MGTTKGYMGEVSFDGRTVTIRKKMRGEVTLPLQAIQSVAIVPAGIGMSGIRFAIAGGTLSGDSKAIGSHRDLARDPYALTFRNKHKATFQALAAEINLARYPNMPQDTV